VCWGCNFYGELGNARDVSRADDAGPVMSIANLTSLFVGRYHTCALVAGSVWCWGINLSGQIGDVMGRRNDSSRSRFLE